MIPGFVKERQENCCKSMASPGFLVSARAKVCWHKPVIPVPNGSRQKDGCKFKAIFHLYNLEELIKKFLLAGSVAQWKITFLACLRTWVQPSALK